MFLNSNISNESLVLLGVKSLSDLVLENSFDLIEQKNQTLINKIIITYSKNEQIIGCLFEIIEKSLDQITKNKFYDPESLKNEQFLNSTTLKNIFYIFLVNFTFKIKIKLYLKIYLFSRNMKIKLKFSFRH